jgi:hypothetical protein
MCNIREFDQDLRASLYNLLKIIKFEDYMVV